MLKQLIFILIFTAFSCSVFAQLKWISFRDLNDSLTIQPRTMLIYIHSNWCKYCKLQENAVFNDPKVIELLNQKVYPLKLDAESREEVIFLGRKYEGASVNSYHELAMHWAAIEGRLTLPSIVILNSNSVYKVINGYIKREKLIAILNEL